MSYPYPVVGVFLLLVLILASHYGVIKLNRKLLHRQKWQVLTWLAGVLGVVIINYILK